MKKIFLVFTFLFYFLGFGQAKVNYAFIDKKMDAIPIQSTTSIDAIAAYIHSNFKTESDKIRAVFYWTASNMSYDVKNMFSNNSNQTSQEKIKIALTTKKGVCIHYAEVFNSISNQLGIKTVIVEGYTKQNGKVATLSHAWCAAKIDSRWYLFDPTWGSGSVTNGNFVKKINDFYFKTEPSQMIASHMPFDYLWQFLNYPITNQEFYDGKIQVDPSKTYFDFVAEIARNNSLSETEKARESAKRIAKNGIKNKRIADYYTSKNKETEVLIQNTNIEKLNLITTNFNKGIALLNDFIYYRNKQFKPTLPDSEISKMIQIPKDIFTNCQNNMESIGFVGEENKSNVISLRTNINDALVRAQGYESFVKEYLGKSKMGRKAMFTKVSWLGIPLN